MGRAGFVSGVAGAESFPGVRKSVKHSREISKCYSTLTTANFSHERTGQIGRFTNHNPQVVNSICGSEARPPAPLGLTHAD